MAAAGLAMLAVAVIPGLPAAASIVLGALFWGGILATFVSAGVSFRATAPFAPLLPVYVATFALDRDVLLRHDWVLNTDTTLHLREALSGAVSPRHPGFPVIRDLGFAIEALVGGAPMETRIPVETLVLQCSVAGVLAAAALATFLGRAGVPRWIGILAGYLYGLSLGPWTFAGVGDTYAISAAFGALFLVVVLPEGGKRSSLLCGALVAVALGVSLENAYLVAVWCLAALLRPRRPLREVVSGFASVVLPGLALAGGMWFVQAERQGERYWHTWGDHKFSAPASNLVEHFVHFRAAYTRAGGVLPEVKALAGVALRFVFPAVRAQSYMRPDEYGIRPSAGAARWPGNLAYLGALALALGTIGSLTRSRWRGTPLRSAAALLVGLFVVRVVAVSAFVPRQSVLFSAPAVLALWGLVGLGTAAFLRDRGSFARRGAGIFLLWIGSLLVASNARYVKSVQNIAGWEPLPPPVTVFATRPASE